MYCMYCGETSSTLPAAAGPNPLGPLPFTGSHNLWWYPHHCLRATFLRGVHECMWVHGLSPPRLQPQGRGVLPAHRFVQHDCRGGEGGREGCSTPVSVTDLGLLCFTARELRHTDINETSLSTYVPSTLLSTRVNEFTIPTSRNSQFSWGRKISRQMQCYWVQRLQMCL